MKLQRKTKRTIFGKVAAASQNLLFRIRASRLPKRSKGYLLYGLWQYIEPKSIGFKKLPRTLPRKKGRPVHILRKYISGGLAERVTSVESAGFDLHVGVTFYTHKGEINADVFVIPKPYSSAERGFVKPKETTSSLQRTAFEEEKKNLKRAVRTLAEQLGLKNPEKLKINFLYP